MGMVQLFSHHPILLCLWAGYENYFMKNYIGKWEELETLFSKAMVSQHIPFMKEVSEIMMQHGFGLHADELHDEIQFLTEEVYHKNTDTVSNRFNDIIRYGGGNTQD